MRFSAYVRRRTSANLAETRSPAVGPYNARITRSSVTDARFPTKHARILARVGKELICSVSGYFFSDRFASLCGFIFLFRESSGTVIQSFFVASMDSDRGNGGEGEGARGEGTGSLSLHLAFLRETS